jgi:uracil-DNA glycosylase
MKTEKKIETHKIGLVGQAPSRRGDPRKPLAGPNGQKIARLAGISHDELIGCRRMHLNTRYSGKRRKGDAFNRAKGTVKAADVLLDWRVERIVLLGKNVARCFGLRDVPFLAEIRIYGRRFLIFPHPSGINRWWNERRNERRARQVLQRFLRGRDGSRMRWQTSSTGTSARTEQLLEAARKDGQCVNVRTTNSTPNRPHRRGESLHHVSGCKSSRN